MKASVTTRSGSACRWQLIACDLDGTLIGKNHHVQERDIAALREAQDAGVQVAICTGRNSLESAGIAAALGLQGQGIFVNGATLCTLDTGRIIARRTMDEALAREVIDCLGQCGHAVLILCEDAATGLPHYKITDHAAPHRATTEWLLSHRVHAEVCSQLPPHTAVLRLTAVVNTGDGGAIVDALQERFRQRVHVENLQSPMYDCQVIEVFRDGVNKWAGILEYCAHNGIDAARVVAIGDDVNDLAMLRNAPLSYAMATASDAVRAAAKRVTAAQAACGVAEAIGQILLE